MKCPSCNYERHYKSEWVKEAILYKSGKNKGALKEVSRRLIELEIGEEDFERCDLLSSHEPHRYVSSDFYSCPECGTLFKDVNK